MLCSATRVLIIEPYYGGSHKELCNFLETILPLAHLATLTPKKWHWRARTGALALSQTIPEQGNYTHLFASSVLNLAELIALRKDLATCKKIIYFHENQIIYPVQKELERDFQYGYNQIISSLCADVVLFNSEYNMKSFLQGIDSFLSKQPDYKMKNLRQKLEGKCSVLYFPVVFPTLSPLKSVSSLLRIVWPHRWEHDKNPASFFNALYKLSDEGVEFTVSVLGETYTDVPDVFAEARLALSKHITHWGYASSKEEYYSILANECDVVVSTAVHEFFGVAMMEAGYLGCYPLVPNRLVYPELFPKECLYSTDNQLYKRLKAFCKRPHLAREKISIDFSKYDANTLRTQYQSVILGGHEVF